MDSVNNFYSIINNKQNDNQNNTIYDELKNKEQKYYDTINRVVDYKTKEHDKNIYFEYTTIKDIVINIFLTLNAIVKELISFNYETFSYNDFIQIFNKGHRIIYLGITTIMIAFFMLLIEISDSGKSIPLALPTL